MKDEAQNSYQGVGSNEQDARNQYQSTKDADGYFFEREEMEAVGLACKVYENGNKIYRAELSDGRTAIIREISSREASGAEQVVGKQKNLLTYAYAAAATKIDGKPIVMEEILDLKAKDGGKIITASNLLNF